MKTFSMRCRPLVKYESNVRYLSLAIVCAAILSFHSGCQFAPQPNKSTWAWQKSTSKVIPDRILPVWTDSVLHQPGQPGVRGFGGRVYFYGKENTEPIEVDGSFAVYVFDAEDNAPTDQKPLRKFVFTADQFKTHMSKTSMGSSYSVWIPWGEVGGTPRKLSLIARFEGREGGTTISDPTIKMLPGIPINKEEGKLGAPPISLAAHSEPVRETQKADKKDGESNVRSIDLPPAFQRHLRWPATNTESIKASESVRALSHPVTDPSESTKPQVETKQPITLNVPSEPAATPVATPVATKVFDYRTRGPQRFSAMSRGKQTKNDLHNGRWIESVSRTNDSNVDSKADK